jgi:hypothetical protein
MLLVFHNNLQASGGGTLYTQSVSGSLTVTGALTIAVILNRTVAGSITLTGSVLRAATYVRAYVASLAVTGALATSFLAGGGGPVAVIRGGLRFMRKFLGRR